VALHSSGALEKFDVELIGANIGAIEAGEDRQLFKEVVERCGAEVPQSLICHSIGGVSGPPPMT
jgi:carbamoyl-phosphate synthase large subunit